MCFFGFIFHRFSSHRPCVSISESMSIFFFCWIFNFSFRTSHRISFNCINVILKTDLTSFDCPSLFDPAYCVLLIFRKFFPSAFLIYFFRRMRWGTHFLKFFNLLRSFLIRCVFDHHRPGHYNVFRYLFNCFFEKRKLVFLGCFLLNQIVPTNYLDRKKRFPSLITFVSSALGFGTWCNSNGVLFISVFVKHNTFNAQFTHSGEHRLSSKFAITNFFYCLYSGFHCSMSRYVILVY